MPVHFSPEEMRTPRERAAASLREHHLDADGNASLFTRLPDLRQARDTSDLQDIRIWQDIEGVNPSEQLRDMLIELGLRSKQLGIELDSYGLKASYWRQLEAALDGFSRWQDASILLDRIRARKSPKELEYARRAAELSDDAWHEAVQLGQPGAFEGDILAAMQGAVFKGGGDYAGNEFIIGSGPAALLVRYQSGRRHLDDNDQLTLEFSGAYRRYHAAMMRTLLVGSAGPEHRQMHAVCRDALHACEAAVCPGHTMGEVFRAHAKIMDAAGYQEHRMNACGYGMGAVYNPLWVDPPMFYEGNPLVIEAGNVFFLHMILADSGTGRAMTLGHTVEVTESGCSVLSRASLDLVVN